MNYLTRFLALWICIAIPQALSSQGISINEISLANVSVKLDPNYDFRGWIELYNPTSTDVEMRDLYFSDRPTEPLKYRLKVRRTLPANGYALVWLNGEMVDADAVPLDFDVDGGFFSVADKNGTVIDQFFYPRQYTNVSFGRTPDGGSQRAYFVNSTPEASNNHARTATRVAPEPSFSLPGGFYDTPQNVHITNASSDVRIFYTLDGTEPSIDDNEYDGTPILISHSVALRAKAISEVMLDGMTAAATYMINERKPDLPVVFITIDSLFLYNDTIGIYTVGTNGVKLTTTGVSANYNQDWTRPAHVEYLDVNHILRFSQFVGIGIFGNQSRRHNLKSLEVKASKRFGNARLDYPFFAEKPGRRYKSFILRNGGQQLEPGFIFRDAYNQSLIDVIDLDYQAYQPVVVYINTQYWGILNMREKSSNDYVYSNYNFDKSAYDFIDRTSAVNGNTRRIKAIEQYVQENNLKDDSVFQYLSTVLDVDNLLNYLSTEIIMINTDWPVNNNKSFSLREDDARFRWILQDVDRGFLYHSRNMISFIRESTNSSFQIRLMQGLFENPSFQERLINRITVLTGSVFREPRMIQRLDSVVAKLRPEYPFHVARWDSTWTDYLEKGLQDTQRKIPIFRRKAYADLASNFNLGSPFPLFISSTEPGATIQFNDFAIPLLPFDGSYFQNRELRLKASEYANGKKFAFWHIVEGDNAYRLDQSDISLQLSASAIITARYNDAPEVRRTGLYINEVSASNSIFVDETFRYEDWIELYNSSDRPIALHDYYLSDRSNNRTMFQFGEDADTIPPFGFGIVWSSGETTRGPMHTNFKLSKDGEEIFLSRMVDGSLVLIDSVAYVPHSDKASFGRFPDGDAQMVIFNRPSFLKPNYQSQYNLPQYFQTTDLIADVAVVAADASGLLPAMHYGNSELQMINPSEALVDIAIYSANGVLMHSATVRDRNYTVRVAAYHPGLYIAIARTAAGNVSLKFLR